jgi:hypothetical protein
LGLPHQDLDPLFVHRSSVPFSRFADHGKRADNLF